MSGTIKPKEFLEGSLAHQAMQGLDIPADHREFEIQRVLDTVTARFVHNLDLGEITNISEPPSVTLCGVVVPMDRFMQKLTDVHEEYMRKGPRDGEADLYLKHVGQAVSNTFQMRHRLETAALPLTSRDRINTVYRECLTDRKQAQDYFEELAKLPVREKQEFLRILNKEPLRLLFEFAISGLRDGEKVRKKLKDFGCERTAPSDPLIIDKSARKLDNFADKKVTRGTSKSFHDKNFNPKKLEKYR